MEREHVRSRCSKNTRKPNSNQPGETNAYHGTKTTTNDRSNRTFDHRYVTEIRARHTKCTNRRILFLSHIDEHHDDGDTSSTPAARVNEPNEEHGRKDTEDAACSSASILTA